MPKPYILVTNGIVQCEHGGTVLLKSAVTNHVVGGKIPVDMESFPGLKIEGCPYHSSVNGQCKTVSSISSASTETNVGWGGRHYVVRTIGKTDKGGALVLADTGQYSHTMPKPGGGSGDPVTLDVIAIDPEKAAEPLPNETCRFHPVRVSGKKLRPLRAYRNFGVFTDYHWAHTNIHTSDRVVTFTDAYLYVTHEGQTDEWRILSLGDPYKPAMGQVFYQRTKDGAVFTGIPFFKSEGKVLFLYANVRLSEADRDKFEPTEFKVDPAASTYLNDYGEISKMVTIDANALKNQHLITADKARDGSDKTVATVVTLKDPIGEVEDLYDDYEFSYAKHYFLNKDLFTDIENRNRYAYAVADILDYLYVSDSEKKVYKEQSAVLLEGYKKLANAVLKDGDFAEALLGSMKDNDLATVIDEKLSGEYADELSFIDKSVLGWMNAPYFAIRDNQGQLYVYGNGFSGYAKRLKLGGAYKQAERDNVQRIFARFIFTAAYSKRFEAARSNASAVKKAASDFYFLLKNATPLAGLSEEARDEICDKLKHQPELQKVFNGSDPLIDEFEQLDTLLKDIAYAPQSAKKLTAKNGFGFKGLKGDPKETRSIIVDKHVTPCMSLADTIAEKLSSPEMADLLGRYMKLLDAAPFDYHHYLMNLALSMLRPRIGIDPEAETCSPFNSANAKLLELLQFIGNRLNNVGEAIARELHEAPVKTHYLDMLYAYIAHAWLEKPNENLPVRKEKGFLDKLFPKGSDNGRSANVEAFLSTFGVPVSKFETDTANINDNNFDKALKVKSESEKLYATLKQLNGITSYVGKFEDTAKTGEETAGKKSGLSGQKGKTIDDNSERLKAIRSSGPYKKLLASTKALGFIMTVANIGEYLQGKEKLKVHNLVGFAGDVLSVGNELASIAEKQATKLPETLEHMAGIQKLVSPASMKVIARFGVIGVVAGTINELNELDLDENPGMFIAVSLKNAVYIALLFSPAWAALGAIAVLELLWFFISDKIYQSKLELYIADSLLFNTTVEHGGQGRYHRKKSKSCHAQIMIESLKASESAGVFTLDGKNIDPDEGFLSAESIRRFIAENYSTHPHAFEIAQIAELSRLKSALYGFNVEIEQSAQKVPVASHGAQFYLNTQHQLQLSKALYDETESVWLSQSIDGKTQYTELPKLRSYNLAAYLASRSNAFGEALETMKFDKLSPALQARAFNSVDRMAVAESILEGDIHIIVTTAQIVLKFAVTFDVATDTANAYAGITECKNVALTDDDYKAIGKDTQDA